MRLSMAWAGTFEKGSTITASRDTSRAARVLKRAVMVGCNSAGVNIDDLEAATVPVTRHQVRSASSIGGVTVRLAPDDPQSVVIRFFDERGLDIDESTQRRVERLYQREEFRRALTPDMGEIGFPGRALEHYTSVLVESLEGGPTGVTEIASAGFKLVLDYSFGTTSFVMPNVLAKLGAEVLVVNPYASTSAVVGNDREISARRVADLVTASGAHLGAVFDPGGELLTLVDDEGKVLTNNEALLIFLTLVTANAAPGSRVCLPVAVPLAAERICNEQGIEILWTKLSPAHLMEASTTPGVVFGASQNGGFIFPAFLPAFDAIGALVNLLGLLVKSGARLSKLTAGLVPIHIAHQSVVTPWDQKGTIMRTLVERSSRRDIILVDGVKLTEDDGWTLILPDPEEPLTHIWAEASTEAAASSRVLEQAARLRQMLR